MAAAALLFGLSIGAGYALRQRATKIYEVIIVGSGLSGLKCAHDLATKHGFAPDDVLVLEAQDYVGGRVKQDLTFLPGVKIDLGAEILHGSDTMLNKFAVEAGEEVEEMFCWAHGDGGPSEHRVNSGYGLYYISGEKGGRLLRFDDGSADFREANEALWKLARLNEDDFDEKLTFKDYVDQEKLSEDMKEMAYAGFSNTLCTNELDLSLKQTVRWSRLWNENGEGDFRFKSSYECLVSYLKRGCEQISINTVVDEVDYADGHGPVTVRARRARDSTGGWENAVYRAKRVVVTASVHVLKSSMIKFSPPLPRDKVDALDCLEFHRVIKIIVKFKKVVFPRHLGGMIMSGAGCPVPEVWFRDVSSQVAKQEDGVCYAVGFATSNIADALVQSGSHEDICLAFVRQLDQVFSHLRPSHVTFGAEVVDDVSALPSPSSQYISGLVQDWRAQHPFIGGGYGSPRAGRSVYYGAVLARPVGDKLFFAGEATSCDRPGATAHSALETGARAALELASRRRATG